MKVSLSKSQGEILLSFQGIPSGQQVGLDDITGHLLSFSREYVQCLDLMAELSKQGDAASLSILYAQVLKAMALLDNASSNLKLGISAAKHDVSPTDLGFPELDDPFYKNIR